MFYQRVRLKANISFDNLSSSETWRTNSCHLVLANLLQVLMKPTHRSTDLRSSPKSNARRSSNGDQAAPMTNSLILALPVFDPHQLAGHALLRLTDAARCHGPEAGNSANWLTCNHRFSTAAVPAAHGDSDNRDAGGETAATRPGRTGTLPPLILNRFPEAERILIA